MHLGIVMECEHRDGGSEVGAFEELFALADLAERTGIDAVWLAERHFAAPGRLQDPAGGTIASVASAPLILATGIAARTTRLRVGIGVSVLPLAHPIRLAEEVETLDQISRGRLDFGIGRSGFQVAYAGYGVPYHESRDRFAECLAILLQAWTQETVEFSGVHYRFSDVSVVPKPYQKPHPPLRIAATTQDTFPLIGSWGYPTFVGLRGADIEQTRGYLATYRQAWRDAGHPGQGDVMLRIPVYVAETEQAAYHEPLESTLRSYKRLAERFSYSATGADAAEDRGNRGDRLSATGYDELLRGRLAYGTPEAVTAKLRQLRDELGLSGFLIEPNVGAGIPREQVFRSVELFATEVGPKLRAG